MKNLKPNGQRAKNAITLIWIILGLEIVSLISGYFQYDMIQTFANNGDISMETADSNDIREQFIGIIYMIAFIISTVTFIQWFRRAYFNLHIKVNNLSHSEGWAAGSWFVPIVNLYRPFQIMKELFGETKKLFIKNEMTVSEIFNTNYLRLWWGFWIINNIIGQFVFRYSRNAETIEELTTLTIAGMIANIVGIPLALITVKIIRGYSKAEVQLNEIKNEE